MPAQIFHAGRMRPTDPTRAVGGSTAGGHTWSSRLARESGWCQGDLGINGHELTTSNSETWLLHRAPASVAAEWRVRPDPRRHTPTAGRPLENTLCSGSCTTAWTVTSKIPPRGDSPEGSKSPGTIWERNSCEKKGKGTQCRASQRRTRCLFQIFAGLLQDCSRGSAGDWVTFHQPAGLTTGELYNKLSVS